MKLARNLFLRMGSIKGDRVLLIRDTLRLNKAPQ